MTRSGGKVTISFTGWLGHCCAEAVPAKATVKARVVANPKTSLRTIMMPPNAAPEGQGTQSLCLASRPTTEK